MNFYYGLVISLLGLAAGLVLARFILRKRFKCLGLIVVIPYIVIKGLFHLDLLSWSYIIEAYGGFSVGFVGTILTNRAGDLFYFVRARD